MRRVALGTLAHEPIRTALVVAGLAAAWALLLVQVGLYRGFSRSSSAVIDRVGGDVWIMAKGTEVFDNAEAIGETPSVRAREHACVANVRALIVDYSQVRRPGGALTTVQVIGVDDGTIARVPWGVVVGQVRDLDNPNAIAVDEGDLLKLGVAAKGSDAIGARIALRSGEARIVAITRGARPFTQTPYVFASASTARERVGLPSGAATYWVLDLRSAGCAAEVIAHMATTEGIDVVTTREISERTRRFWIESTGIGTILTAGSLLAFGVTIVTLLQTLSTQVKAHLRELVTLRALGASRGELTSFVAWQAVVITMLGLAFAWVVALALGHTLTGAGMLVVLDAGAAVVSVGGALASAGVASAVAGRLVMRVELREVLE